MNDMPHYEIELITTGHSKDDGSIVLVTDMGGLIINNLQAQQLRNHLVEFLGEVAPVVFPPEQVRPFLKIVKE